MDQPTAEITLSDLDNRLTLSVAETAQLIGIGKAAAYEAIRRGDIPSRRLGRRIIVPGTGLLEWLGIDQ